jgi:hypothetical protein
LDIDFAKKLRAKRIYYSEAIRVMKKRYNLRARSAIRYPHGLKATLRTAPWWGKVSLGGPARCCSSAIAHKQTAS